MFLKIHLSGAPPLFDPDQGVVVVAMGIAKLAAVLKMGKFKGQVARLFVNKGVGVVEVHVFLVVSN